MFDRFLKVGIVVAFLVLSIDGTASAEVPNVARTEIRNILPRQSKDKLFCNVSGSPLVGRLEVLLFAKKGSKYIGLSKYFKLKTTRSATRTIISKRLNIALRKCDEFRKSLISDPTPIPTPSATPRVTPPNGASPTATIPIPSPTPTRVTTPIFQLNSVSSFTVPKKLSSDSTTIDNAVEIQCTGCDDAFAVEVGNFSPSLFESVSASLISPLNKMQLRAEQVTSSVGVSVSVSLQPLYVGTGRVSLIARYKGQGFPVDGDVVITTQSDSITFSDAIFVSRDTGSDLPSQTGSPGAPLASFSEAMSRALTQLYAASGPAKNVTILLGDGAHLVDSTISINQSRIRQSDSLTIIPWDNAKPIVFLGREFPKNSWSMDNRGRWVSCHLGSQISDTNFLSSTLYKNLEPLSPARFPNSGMLVTNPVYENDGITLKKDRFSFAEGGLPSLQPGSAIQVTFVDQYIIYKSDATISGNTINIPNTLYQGKFFSRSGERHEFYIEGQKDLIDGQVISATGDTAYEYAQEGGCVYHNHALFNPSVDTIRYALPSHSGLLRIYQGTPNSGEINISGIQLAGGALAKHGGSSGPNFGNPTANHALVVFEAASNISVLDSFIGPTGMAGMIGYRDVTNIKIDGNVFKNISGPAVSIVGYDFRPEASARALMFENNAFVSPNPASLMSRGINLGYVSDTIVRNNYFKDLYQSSISVAGLRYYYSALTWCQRVECPRLLGKGSCSATEQTRVCQCDPANPPSGMTCINNGSNVRKLSWEDSQEYNPTRNVVIQGNFVEGGLAPVNDAGLIYIWGIPYGDSNLSQSCIEDPVGCKATTNVSVVDNVTLNNRATTGANHFVHFYGDDGANSTDFRRNVAINPEGSAILVFSKGQGGTIEDNLLIGSEKSSHAMLNFAEFNATSNVATAPFLAINKELNRKKVIRGNAFVQLPSTSSPPSGERGSLLFFSNWDPESNDGYGNVLLSSSENVFAETEYGKSIRKSVFLRPPTPELLLTIQGWKSHQFSGGRYFDVDAKTPTILTPSKLELFNGFLPSHPDIEYLRSNLPEQVGIAKLGSRYDEELNLARTKFVIQN